MSKKTPTITVDEWEKELARLQESHIKKDVVAVNDIARKVGANTASFQSWVRQRGFEPFKATTPESKGHLVLVVTPADAVQICQQRAAEGYQIK